MMDSGKPQDSTLRVRVRPTMAHEFVWELVTEDGHVIQTSRPFGDRKACARDAEQHGLVVNGAGSKRSGNGSGKRARDPGWRIARDSSGVWHWEWHAIEDVPVVKSSCGFLTRNECEADARQHGYPARLASA